VLSVDKCYRSLLGNTTILAKVEVFYMWFIPPLYNEIPLLATIAKIGELAVEFPCSVQWAEDNSM
jgi:hypothetical protein